MKIEYNPSHVINDKVKDHKIKLYRKFRPCPDTIISLLRRIRE